MQMTATITRMGRKKKEPPAGGEDATRRSTSGKHVRPRTPMQMPKEWLAVARKIATELRQPTMWYLVGLIMEDAKNRGPDKIGLAKLPIPPWEEKAGKADVDADL